MDTTKSAAYSDKVRSNDLRQDINALKRDATALASHAVAAGTENMNQLRGQASEQIDQLKDAGKKGMARVEKHIQEKPAQSLAIAFAVGAVLSLLLGRK